jgi:type I restriction enzyme S subunit
VNERKQKYSEIGWTLVELREVGRILTGSTPPKAKTEYYGGSFPFVKPPELHHGPVNDAEDKLSEKGAEIADIAPVGSVLVSCIGNLGKTGLAMRPVAFNQQINAIIPNDLNASKWIFYAVQTPEFASQLASVASATTIAIVNKGKFSGLKIPLAPEAEQQKIIAEVEKQFTRLEAGVAGLRRVQANLKRYRAAVLKAACEGKLVPTEAELSRERKKVAAASRRWSSDELRRRDASATISDVKATAEMNQSRDGSATQEGPGYETGAQLLERILTERRQKWSGKGKYKEPEKPDTPNLPELPEGWVWAIFEQVSRRVTVGHVGPMKHEYVPRGVPFLRSQNVRENKFDYEGLLFISREFHARLAKSVLMPGDLAVVRSGSVGVTCVIPDTLGEANCADLVLIQRPFIVPQFGAYYMNSLAKRIVDAGKVGVALTHFNTKSVSAMPVPIPPLTEQQRIVAEVERRLSVVEELETVVNANLRRATRFRQSILDQAFQENSYAMQSAGLSEKAAR